MLFTPLAQTINIRKGKVLDHISICIKMNTCMKIFFSTERPIQKIFHKKSPNV